MKASTALETFGRVTLIRSLRTASFLFCTPLRHAQQRVVQSFTAHKNRQTMCVGQSARHAASAYTMLVESDIHDGIHGMLP